MALPDNQHALSGSDDKTVKLFNVNDGAVLRTFLLAFAEGRADGCKPSCAASAHTLLSTW